MTIGSSLKFIVAHPGCCVNDVLEAHGLALEDRLSDEDYVDREYTGAALLDWLHREGYVTYVVTPREGWRHTATEKAWP